MENQSETVHHQTMRCTMRGPVARDTSWDRVTCDDCHDVRTRRSRLNRRLGIGVLVMVLLFISCTTLVVAIGNDGPEPPPGGSHPTPIPVNPAIVACREFRAAVQQGLDQGISTNVMAVHLMRELNMTDGEVAQMVTDCMVVLMDQPTPVPTATPVLPALETLPTSAPSAKIGSDLFTAYSDASNAYKDAKSGDRERLREGLCRAALAAGKNKVGIVNRRFGVPGKPICP